MSDNELTYVGWKGATEYATPDIELGWGATRGLPDYGPRRAVWDAAFGYVSGFRKRSILYYVMTRSLSQRLERWAMKREGVTFVDGVAVALSPAVRPVDTSGEQA